MILNDLAKQRINWLPDSINENNIVLSSRVRLARNLNNYPFPIRLNKQQQILLLDNIVSVVQKIWNFSEIQILKLNDLDKVDRMLLMERHLVSYNHAVNVSGEPGLIYKKDETLSIMINEEDHLRTQIIGKGLSLRGIWETLSEIDDKLNRYLLFAFHKKYGFLTSCPTNVGTGLRVSCLVHLPGLVLTEQIEKLIDNLLKIGICVRGFHGEGTDPEGDIFQISNTRTLGKTEEDIISDFEKVILTIIKYEKEARKKLIENKFRQRVEDAVYRAYGIMYNAKLLNSNELVAYISKILLGLWLKMDLSIKTDLIYQLIFILQPAHLQEFIGKQIDSQQRDGIRAELIHRYLFS